MNTMAKNGEETNKVARRAAAIEIAQSVLACFDDSFLSKEEFEWKEKFYNGHFGHILKQRIRFAEANVTAKNLPRHNNNSKPHFIAKKEGFRPIAPFLKISEVINLRLINQRMSNYMLVMSTTHLIDWGLSHHFVSF